MALKPNFKTKSLNARYHNAFVDFLKTQDFTHVLTLHWGKERCIGYDRILPDLKRLHAKVDCSLLGNRFHKKPNRSEAVFFVEGEDRLNLHVHSFWRVDQKHHDHFNALFIPPPPLSSIWRDIAPIGTCDLQPNDTPEAAAKYLTKQAHYDSDDRRLIFSQDFLPVVHPLKNASA